MEAQPALVHGVGAVEALQATLAAAPAHLHGVNGHAHFPPATAQEHLQHAAEAYAYATAAAAAHQMDTTNGALTGIEVAEKKKRKRTNRKDKGLDAFRHALLQHLEQHARLTPTTTAAAAAAPAPTSGLHFLPATPDEGKPSTDVDSVTNHAPSSSASTPALHSLVAAAGPASSGSTPASALVSEQQRLAWLREYEHKIMDYSIKGLVKESVKFRFPCAPYIILVPNWHALREALWLHLKAIGVKKAKRSVSTKKDLIDICIQPEVAFDFSEFVKDAESHGNRKEKGEEGTQAQMASVPAAAATAGPAAAAATAVGGAAGLPVHATAAAAVVTATSSGKQPPRKRAKKDKATTSALDASAAHPHGRHRAAAGSTSRPHSRRRSHAKDDDSDANMDDSREHATEASTGDDSSNSLHPLHQSPVVSTVSASAPQMTQQQQQPHHQQQQQHGGGGGHFQQHHHQQQQPHPSSHQTGYPAGGAAGGGVSHSQPPPVSSSSPSILTSRDVIHQFLNLQPSEYQSFKAWFYLNIVQRENPGLNITVSAGNGQTTSTNNGQQHQQQGYAMQQQHHLYHHPPSNGPSGVLHSLPSTPLLTGSSMLPPLTPSHYPVHEALRPQAVAAEAQQQREASGGGNGGGGGANGNGNTHGSGVPSSFQQWSNSVLMTPQLTSSTPLLHSSSHPPHHHHHQHNPSLGSPRHLSSSQIGSPRLGHLPSPRLPSSTPLGSPVGLSGGLGHHHSSVLGSPAGFFSPPMSGVDGGAGVNGGSVSQAAQAAAVQAANASNQAAKLQRKLLKQQLRLEQLREKRQQQAAGAQSKHGGAGSDDEESDGDDDDDEEEEGEGEDDSDSDEEDGPSSNKVQHAHQQQLQSHQQQQHAHPHGGGGGGGTNSLLNTPMHSPLMPPPSSVPSPYVQRRSHLINLSQLTHHQAPSSPYPNIPSPSLRALYRVTGAPSSGGGGLASHQPSPVQTPIHSGMAAPTGSMHQPAHHPAYSISPDAELSLAHLKHGNGLPPVSPHQNKQNAPPAASGQATPTQKTG